MFEASLSTYSGLHSVSCTVCLLLEPCAASAIVKDCRAVFFILIFVIGSFMTNNVHICSYPSCRVTSNLGNYCSHILHVQPASTNYIQEKKYGATEALEYLYAT
jgi:hypothetical protein